jgi:chromosome segregation ATPase
MKTACGVALLVAGAAAKNPLGEVLSLMSDLSAKVTKEKEAEAKAYGEYFEWCDDVAKNKQNEITTATAQKGKLEATIDELAADIQAGETKIGELAADISTSTADLEAATAIRQKEAADFAKGEKELVDVIDTLGRAVTILQREMQKNPAALAQIGNNGMQGVIQSLSAVVDAAGFTSVDKQRLTALVQAQQGAADDDSDLELGAPAAATYKTHSSNIFDVLEDLKEKAESELGELRQAETSAAHNYGMLKQSLEDQLTNDNKDKDAETSGKAANEENKAIAEGDLEVTTADLKAGNQALATASSTCMQVAADHQATVAAREAELKVIAEATKILKDTTSGADGQTYSLLQVGSAIQSRSDLARSEVITLVKKLAREHHSAALAQLASRIAAVVRYGASSGDDPFGKVKGLIEDMITKLEQTASSEATEKAYCDDEMAKTELKKGELEATSAKLTTKIDQAAARSAQLKSEVKELQAELAKMASEQASAEQWRRDSHAEYVTAKADLEQGLGGVRKALNVLQEYYAQGSALVQQPAVPELHSAASGAGQSIVGILEVVESDFADNLAKTESEESTSQEAFEKDTQEFKISKTKKDQDVKYKTQEFTGLDKSISELSSDRETTDTELSAVNEYYSKLKDRCIAKPETYESRKARREAEISGLKEALRILESETAFTQKSGKRHRHMRGALQL